MAAFVAMAELSSCDRNHMACKTKKNLLSYPLQEKFADFAVQRKFDYL